MKDNVIKPDHYNQGSIEPIDAIMDWLSVNGMNGAEGFCAGNVIKYLARAGLKDNKQEDLNKALFYMKKLAGEEPRIYLDKNKKEEPVTWLVDVSDGEPEISVIESVDSEGLTNKYYKKEYKAMTQTELDEYINNLKSDCND